MVPALVGFGWEPLVGQNTAGEVRHYKANVRPTDVDARQASQFGFDFQQDPAPPSFRGPQSPLEHKPSIHCFAHDKADMAGRKPRDFCEVGTRQGTARVNAP